MTYIEVASIVFGVAAGLSFLLAFVQAWEAIEADEPHWDAVVRNVVIGLVLTGVALWSWRIAEGFEAFVEAFK